MVNGHTGCGRACRSKLRALKNPFFVVIARSPESISGLLAMTIFRGFSAVSN
jgi:hypothetical protein